MHATIFTKNYWTFLRLLLLCNSVHAQTADFNYTSADSLYCTPYQIIFTQTCTGTPSGFIWNFGNGQRSSNPEEAVVYNTAGVYRVTLTAVYANTAVSTTKTITINSTPAVSLAADNNELCKPGIVQFTAAGSNLIRGYEWDFGDGSPVQQSTSGSMAYAYRNYGNYTASLRAVAASGCQATSTYGIAVNRPGITASISTTSGCVPVSPVFNAMASLPAGDAVLNYQWNFGDGSPVYNSENGQVVHNYNNTQKINTAHVIISSAQGCSNRFDFPEFAYGTPPYNTTVRTVAAKDSFCGSETIEFYCKAANANSYTWEFGDSTTLVTTDSLVSHKYRKLGNKRVTVTPFFNGCAGEKDSIRIFIKGVISGFNYGNLCSNKNAYHFTNLSSGNITHFEWEFSGNTIVIDSANFNAVHSFPVSGSFMAALSLTDSSTGCTDQVSYPIYTAVPSFTSNTGSVCKDSLITYQTLNTYPGNAGYTYVFKVNNNSISNGADSVLNDYPAAHGSFTEYVVINDAVPGTCSDSIYLGHPTIVKGPVVKYTAPPQLCLDHAFTFTNNSYPYYSTDPIAKWRWNFGDNQEDSIQNPLPHKYTRPAGYGITLTATDINGCGSEIRKIVLAAPLPMIIAFPALDTICQQRDTTLLTGYTIDSLLWLPNYSISCNYCDSAYASPAVTTTYIAQATNRFGCRRYDTCVIRVYSPFQIRVTPADTMVCPGQQVAYNLNLPGLISTWFPATYLNNSNIYNPVAVPADSINYQVVVKDSAGCYSDSAVTRLQVFPLPSVNAGPDRILPYNSPYSITPDYSPDAISYLWQPSLDLSCADCRNPSGIAIRSGTYQVTVTSAEGCTASDKISIIIACENGNLLLPTAFSPNGNGINENFYPITRGYKNIRTFMIFNRRGNKVFERKNFAPNIPSLGWNGISRNGENAADPETFAWYIEAECDQGELVKSKGTVVLIK